MFSRISAGILLFTVFLLPVNGQVSLIAMNYHSRPDHIIIANQLITEAVDFEKSAEKSIIPFGVSLRIIAASTPENCDGSSDGKITAKASGGTPAYLYTIDDFLTSQLSNIFTGLSAGQYTVKVKDIADNIASVEITITARALPNSPAANNTNVCYDGNPHTAFATPPGGANVVYYDAATGGNITSAPANSEVGVYSVWAESVDNISSVCVSTSRTLVTLTINSLPVISAPSSVCVGSTINLSPATGGTWISNTPSVATVTNAGVVTGVAPGNVTFTFTETFTGCTKTTSAVTVNQLPVISAPASVCVGSTINLSPASGGTWISNSPAFATVTIEGIVTGIAPGSVTFTFTETGTGCINTTPAVTVNPLPVVSASASVCAGSKINLSPATGGTWISNTPSVATVTNAGVVTGVAPGNVTFTFTETVTGCTKSTGNVIVNPTPTVNGTNNNQTICSGAPISNIVITNPNAVPGTSFSWARNNAVNLTGIAASGIGSPISGTLTNNTNTQQTTIFTITASTAEGCSGTTTATVIVNPQPNISATPSTQTICSGVPITQIDITNPNNVAGTTFSWNRTNFANLSGIPANGTGPAINGTITNTTNTQQTTTFTITATAGTCISTTNVTVIVNPTPNISATNNNQTTCSGTPISNIVLTNPNAITGTTFSWIRDNEVNLTGISNSGNVSPISGILTNNTNTQQTTLFTIIASTAAGCSITTSATVIVNPQPTINATPSTQTTCSGIPITQIDITNPNNVAGTTFSWNRTNIVNLTGIPANGTGSAITGTLVNTTSTPQTTSFSITATTGTCITTAIVTVIINPTPTVSATNNNQITCSGAPISNIVITNPNAVPGTSVSWARNNAVNLTGIAASGNGSPISGTLTNNTNTQQTTILTITASTAAGCFVATTATVIVNPQPTINATPSTQTLCSGVPITQIDISNPNNVAGTTFSWNRTNIANLTGVPANGTGSTITGTLTNATNTQQTTIFTITATAGTCTSTANVTVIVNPTPTVSVTNNNQMTCSGTPISNIVITNPNAVPGTSYIWTRNNIVNLTGIAASGNGSPISGALSNNTAIQQTTVFTINASAASGCSGTTTATVLVQAPVNQGSIAADQTICLNGDPVAFTNTSSGTGSGVIFYRWESSPDGIASWSTIAGASGATYDPPAPMAVNTFYRRITISIQNGVSCESNPSNILKVTVQGSVVAGTISADKTMCAGDDPAGFTGTPATGNGTISYQWQISTDGSSFSDIPGATLQNYDSGPLIADTWFRRNMSSTINGSSCTATSNVILITVNNFDPGTVAASQILCMGETSVPFTSSVIASGDGSITYQWQSSITNATTGFSDIAGANGTTYGPPTPAATTWYRRMAVSTLNGVICSLPSNVIDITIGSFNPGTISPINTKFCGNGDPGSITGTVVPDNPPSFLQGYQWQISIDNISWNDIAGITSQNYDPPAIAVTTYFRRIAFMKTNGKICSAISNVSSWIIYPVPTLTVTTPVEACEGSPITITCTGGNTPTYTLTYVSGTFVIAPAIQTNTTGTFNVTLPAPPPVGQQRFTVSVTNGDAGACSVTKPVIVDIWDVPNITLTPSCSAVTNSGTITMTGTVTYPAGAIVEYRIIKNPTGSWSAWTSNPVFSNLSIGSYTVEARNSMHPNCITTLTGDVLSITVQTSDLEVCQNGTIPAGQGLTGASYCITWGDANSLTGNSCTDASHTYNRSSSQNPPYSSGPLVQYGIYATFIAPSGSMTFKDCGGSVGSESYSIYTYPFNPAQPANGFIRWVPNRCPGGSGNVINGLDPNTIYVLVLNSANSTTPFCSSVSFTNADKIQVAKSTEPVKWFTSPTSTTPIFTGSPFNPLTTAGSGVSNTSCPGTYIFYAGCGVGVTCREPAFFTINPIPIVVAINDTICSGSSANILLRSKESCGNTIIDPAKVTYEWYATPNGSVTGEEGCTAVIPCTGSVIAMPLTSTTTLICPTITYTVRSKVGTCWGLWYTVNVLIINQNCITPPVAPAKAVYTCLSMVPAPYTLTASHACLGTLTALGVDSNNGGSGCPGSPLIITRTWTFKDKCVTIPIRQIIRVVDSIPPTFTQPIDKTIYTDATCGYRVNPIFTGDVADEADNCTPSGLNALYTDLVVDGPCQGSKIITRTWRLKDGCNNITTKVQTITVSDNIPPTFTRPADITIFEGASCTNNPDIAATGDVTNEKDNCSTGLQATFTDVFNNTNPCNIIITRTWHLSDHCGNAAANQVQTITVKDNLPPTFTRPANITIYTDANCNYDASVSKTVDVTNELDNCSTGLQATYTDVTANGPCEGSHVITRTWHLVDNCGNAAANQVQVITVNDNTPPAFTRPPDITIYTDASCIYDASLVKTGSATNVWDNCSTGILPTYTDNITNGSCSGAKTINRTWSLADKCGNSAADQVQVISVKDIIPPAFITTPTQFYSYCVLNITEASYYPDTIDITPVRPDYYILTATDKINMSVNPTTYADNCTPQNNVVFHWRIDFSGGIPASIAGIGPLSDYTGIIRFRGSATGNVDHYISYWLVDDCGNPSSEVIATITINPRPNVIKITN